MLAHMTRRKKIVLLAGFAGTALAAARFLVFVFDGSFSGMNRDVQRLFLLLSAVIPVSFAILFWRGREPVLPLPVAWIGAVLGGFVGFLGFLFVMTDPANWLILVAAVLVGAGLMVFSREAFDQAREAR